MNKLNKLVTNYPVSLTPEEVENLSLTLSAVHTAKDEGKTYSGEGFVNVNNTNNTISLTTEANEKLNQPIPTKVSDLTDSASYQTTAGMNDYLTKTSASENLAPLSVTADIEALKNTSGDFSLYYEKTETSSKDELSSEFIKYVTTTEFNSITGDVSTLKSASSDWNKVSDKLDTSAFSTVSGDFVIKNDLDGYATKSYLETASGELLTTAQYKTDSATFVLKPQLDEYATKEYANDASANALSEAKTWVGQQGYLSAIPDTYALKTDIPTTVAQLTDSGNYYEKTDTSSKDELSTEFAKYQVAGDYITTTLLDTVSSTLVDDIEYVSGQVDNKVDKPTTSLIDKYLVLRTDGNGEVSGWCDFQDQSYSKTEALGTFVATANIDTATLSGDGKSSATKLGVKTDVMATIDYVNSSFLPTSGGTVSGELVVSATTGTFDSSYVKCVNNGTDGYSRFGVGSYGGAVIKAVNGNDNVQVNVKYNANNNELVQVQKDGTDIGFLIPAVTATTTAGLTNDGILHIILES